jgi:hypothetical protein
MTASSFQVFGLVSLTAYLGLLWLKAILSFRYAHQTRQTLPVEAQTTILQPILSGDPLLEETLEETLAHNLEVEPESLASWGIHDTGGHVLSVNQGNPCLGQISLAN